jgi:UDP-GlcNAc:undecaprenyl-phosphate GlcNAc-1-phosphate transferase
MRIPYSLILAFSTMAFVLLVTPLVIAFARRIGAMDRPGPRRIHSEPVPTLGGLALVAAVLGGAWIARALPGAATLLDARPLIGLTVATLPILLLGLLDDTRGVPPLGKLAFQVIGALILVAYGYGVPYITNPWGEAIPAGTLNPILTVAWVVLVMNAVNLIDGMDGLAAGAVMIASAALWWVGRSHEDFYVMFVTALTIGACAGFLRYNFPPARIFMGDTGSHFLGLALAAVSLLENRKGTAAVTLLFPLITMALPLADSALAFVRRLVTGKPVFHADSEHIHHRLLRLGLSARTVLFVLWCVCLYVGLMAVVLATLPLGYAMLLALIVGAGLLFAFMVLDFVDRRLRERAAKDDARS